MADHTPSVNEIAMQKVALVQVRRAEAVPGEAVPGESQQIKVARRKQTGLAHIANHNRIAAAALEHPVEARVYNILRFPLSFLKNGF
jgi:hypothetical protein